VESFTTVSACSHERGKLYQDPIYGAKTLSPLAVAIIDTPEFQRLGGLRQLGFTDVVYRGAHHSRLEHSIGTYLICKQIMRRIVQNHERFDLEHPGTHVSTRFREFPSNSGLSRNTNSVNARWRGLAEVVSAAALLHDLGHVAFGHTLEDEFAGIFLRHDRVAGPRLYELLFNEQSELGKVFSDFPPWLHDISNEELRELIYVILNWKEDVKELRDFNSILAKQISKTEQAGKSAEKQLERLRRLQEWHSKFTKEEDPLFEPFMSDIIGNTICSDLLDYLPRDRTNLGMEARRHERLQRYFTIRRGTLHLSEGYRMSIMVTRKGRGGQRRDVASAVLDIMYERFEMAEGVYYHHKKAAASTMLARLAELAGSPEKDVRPRDDEAIYPAPWTSGYKSDGRPPHIMHFSDGELIDYLGSRVKITLTDKSLEAHYRALQRKLYLALRYRRRDMYRTLLVIDIDLVRTSTHPISHFTSKWRGEHGAPDNAGRKALEKSLAEAAGVKDGDVLVYCPDANMQSKEIDARLEIQEDKILPLREQDDFVYRPDIETLQGYYRSLWRAYVFVSPQVFADKKKCQAIVDAFCAEFSVNQEAAYRKVRGHSFELRISSIAEDTDLVDAGLLFERIRPLVGQLEDENAVRESLEKFAATANVRPTAERMRIRNEVLEFLEEGARDAPLLLNRFDVKRFDSQLNQLLRTPDGTRDANE
jgi:HD superfamily phosphohydrolase